MRDIVYVPQDCLHLSLFFIWQGTGIDLALKNGYVILKFNNQVLKSNKQYQDGKWHYLTVIKRSQGYEIGSHPDPELITNRK